MLFLVVSNLLFWDSISHWTWCSLIRLDWLASGLQGSLCPCLEVLRLQACVPHLFNFFNMSSRNETQVLMLVQQTVYPLSHLPTPQPQILDDERCLLMSHGLKWPIFLLKMLQVRILCGFVAFSILSQMAPHSYALVLCPLPVFLAFPRAGPRLENVPALTSRGGCSSFQLLFAAQHLATCPMCRRMSISV